MRHRAVRALNALSVLLLTGCGGGASTSSSASTSGSAQVRVTPSAGDSAFRRSVRVATLVFVGTVIRRGATTDADVPATRLTSVVRADRVLRGPSGSGNFAGDTLTLVNSPADTLGLSAGRQATFFAYGLAAGETLIVRGMFSFDASTPDSANLVARALELAVQLDADEALARLARDADLVVRAVVTQQDTVPMPDSILRRYGNERSPRWWRAVVSRPLYVGGDSTLLRQTLGVYYPVGAGDDDRWPTRFALGDTLIFLLRRASGMPRAMPLVVDTAGWFFVYRRSEVLPKSDSARLRKAFP